MSDWVSFYDFKHSVIYVNARHRDVHYARIAEDIRAHIPSPAARVLDYGSGEASYADRIAAKCGSLVLAEAAPNVRAALTQRFADNAKIKVMTPEQVAALAPGSFDFIVMHSVSQYLAVAELEGLLAMFRHLLKPDGLLAIGDVVPARFASLFAAMALLRFGAANGFFGAAILGLLRIVASDYLRLRKAIGLSHYTAPAMIGKLAAAGFTAQRAERNIGHNQARMTFLARVK